MKIFVETERFILREIIDSDVDGLFELDSNPNVHRYLGNNPVTSKEQVKEVISFIRMQYKKNGIGRWAIIDKANGNFIGWCGLKYITDKTNNHINFYDLGYRIIEKYWKKGIATETAIACLNYAFEELKIIELCASADCDNDASNKILSNLGFSLIETYYYEDVKCNWYKISKEEYFSINT